MIKRVSRLIEESGIELRIASLIEPVLEDMGYRLVRVRISGQNGCTLQIMAEREDGTLTIEDCEKITKGVSPVLDVEDLISGRYYVEVSSAGIDRPLVRESDFNAWLGHEIKIALKTPLEGKRRLRGILLGVQEQSVGVRVLLSKQESLDHWIPAENINWTQLMLTDALIEASQRRFSQRSPNEETLQVH